MMAIPYGFDCYTFQKEEIKYFDRDIFTVKDSKLPEKMRKTNKSALSSGYSDKPPPLTSAVLAAAAVTTTADHLKFTRKNEDYPMEQVLALGRAQRLNMSEMDKRIFCGIKIQLGIGVVSSFLRKGLQYKQPIKGRSELVNGSWTGIMKGLTVERDSPLSYDVAFGNFLAWDEEFPYIKFGPFFAIESKLVMLTGSSRRIEASSFGTNITQEIWMTILLSLLILAALASARIHWQSVEDSSLEHVLQQLSLVRSKSANERLILKNEIPTTSNEQSLLKLLLDFIFIYITMLLNKPSIEFDELIWPHHSNQITPDYLHPKKKLAKLRYEEELYYSLKENKILKYHYDRIRRGRKKHGSQSRLPTSIRLLSYMWSAACLVIASVYSGEMLAVMLLHADTNVDTIAQLINAKPPIEPVIRQDDFTYQLMLKSLDENMLRLHSKTRIISRNEVYTRQFIESVSQRKVALLGDDELIETIYDLYHKYYPLHKSKMTYLQYPISIMYRKDLNSTMEQQLRRGLVQMFEMGLVHRWYQAQKDTYIQFYDTYERKSNEKNTTSVIDADSSSNTEHNYKPLSMAQFSSFFKAMFYCLIFSFLILALEIIYHKLTGEPEQWRQKT